MRPPQPPTHPGKYIRGHDIWSLGNQIQFTKPNTPNQIFSLETKPNILWFYGYPLITFSEKKFSVMLVPVNQIQTNFR